MCSSTTHLDLHSYLVLSTYLKWLWSSDSKMSKVKKKLQREIIKKVSKIELSILCTVCLLMWVHIPTRYHPNILKKFWSYRAYTKNCEKMQRKITRKVSKLELCHLCAACLIIWIYIPIKVHPNTLNSFGVMEYYYCNTEICEK